MNRDMTEQVWALCAAFLAADGVVQIAQKGQWAERYFATLLPSLSRFNTSTVAELYENPVNLARGQALLMDLFGDGVPDDVLRYVLQMIHVERRLSAKPALVQTLIDGLHQADRQIQAFGLLHDNVFARYSSLYQETASQAARRIMVRGNPQFLRNARNAAQLRTLLLCGIRAASMWRANGGSRWQMMFGRKAIVEAAREMVF